MKSLCMVSPSGEHPADILFWGFAPLEYLECLCGAGFISFSCTCAWLVDCCLLIPRQELLLWKEKNGRIDCVLVLSAMLVTREILWPRFREAEVAYPDKPQSISVTELEISCVMLSLDHLTSYSLTCCISLVCDYSVWASSAFDKWDAC